MKAPLIRHDLIYARDQADPSYFYVKDPIRGQFFRFNELQVGMMELLDGQHTARQIAHELSVVFEAEISEESVERVIGRLDKDLLLDVTSYRLDSEKDRKLVRKALQKKGLVWRAAKRDGETEEGALFQRGIDQILDGDPCEAGATFARVIALNPNNQRARQVFDTIHEAYFQRFRLIPSDVRMVHVWNPDSFLATIDRWFGRFVFTPWFVAFIVFMALLSLEPFLLTSWPNVSSFGWVDLLLYVPTSLVWLWFHEMGHALACKHYGGSVTDTGMMVRYGVQVAAYCDTSDSYTFASRRHKVVVSLAGPLASILVNSILVWVFYWTSDDFFLRNPITILLVLGYFMVFQNLVPFIKLDGYYALADLLGIRNLRERSFDYAAQRLKTVLLGIPAQPERLTPFERNIFWIYAILGGAFTTIYILGLYLSWLLPRLVQYFGAFGLALTVLWSVKMLKGIVIQPLYTFIRMLVQNRQHIFTMRRTGAFASAAGCVYLVLSYELPLHIDGDLEVEPTQRVPIRSSQEGQLGVIHVTEGQYVHTGDVLVEMSNPELGMARERAHASLAGARSQLDLLRHGPRPEEIALSRAEANHAKVASHYASINAGRKERLRAAGLLTESAALDAERAERKSELEHHGRALDVEMKMAGARTEDVAEAEAIVTLMAAKLEELDDRVQALTIRSPIDGVVVGHRIEILLDKKVARGEKLFEVHELGRLRPIVLVPPTELVGAVAVGQRVLLRAHCDTDRLVEATVQSVLPGVRDDQSVAVVLNDIDNVSTWPSGIGGQARIYAAPRSLAFLIFGVPVMTIIQYEAWRYWG